MLTRGFYITLILSTDEMVYLEKLLNTVLEILLYLTKSSRILSLVLFTRQSSNWIFVSSYFKKITFLFVILPRSLLQLRNGLSFSQAENYWMEMEQGVWCMPSFAVIWCFLYRDNTLREAGEKQN